MGWKIPEIKIRVPEVRAPKVKAARAMPKPRAARKPVGEKMGWFSLTIFSSNKAPTESKYVDVIRALIETGGNRRAAAKRLKTNHNAVCRHAKSIRQMPDSDLQKYAIQLKTTVDEIKRVCADSGAAKGITHIDIIRELIISDGKRITAARKLGIAGSVIGHHIKNIRIMPDAILQEYATRLNTTADEIKRVCADIGTTKGITRIDIIRELLASGGSRTTAARNLQITTGSVVQHAKNIRIMPDATLQTYATRLNTTVDEIKRVCADIGTTKGITHIDIIRELIASGGSRTIAAQNLEIATTNVVQHAKNIRQLPDAALQKYADELNKKLLTKITVKGIREIIAPARTRRVDFKRKAQIIQSLIDCDGSRSIAAQKLGITKSVISGHAKSIRRMPDAQLRRYAEELGVSVPEIKRVCADFSSTKGVTHTEIIKALCASGGSRIIAAQSIGVTEGAVVGHAKNISRLPNAKLQEYAKKLNITIGEIKRVCADSGATKGITHIDIIRELLACEGSRTNAAQSLRISDSTVGHHTQNIMRLPESKLSQYAVELGVSVERIREVCAPRLEQAKKLFEK